MLRRRHEHGSERWIPAAKQYLQATAVITRYVTICTTAAITKSTNTSAVSAPVVRPPSTNSVDSTSLAPNDSTTASSFHSTAKSDGPPSCSSRRFRSPSGAIPIPTLSNASGSFYGCKFGRCFTSPTHVRYSKQRRPPIWKLPHDPTACTTPFNVQRESSWYTKPPCSGWRSRRPISTVCVHASAYDGPRGFSGVWFHATRHESAALSRGGHRCRSNRWPCTDPIRDGPSRIT